MNGSAALKDWFLGKPQCVRCGLRVVPNGQAFAAFLVVFLSAMFAARWMLPEDFALVRSASLLIAALVGAPVLVAATYAGLTTRFRPDPQSRGWRIAMAFIPAIWLLSVIVRDLLA